jgi:hypothetical protein
MRSRLVEKRHELLSRGGPKLLRRQVVRASVVGKERFPERLARQYEVSDFDNSMLGRENARTSLTCGCERKSRT